MEWSLAWSLAPNFFVCQKMKEKNIRERVKIKIGNMQSFYYEI